ncbi:hypothetical protein QOZ80_9BG0695190 [Eleusine coracana subsp. coracana]|nr:hypothetical protein QOZ80_9BG0695190 [Eleusine coracana subsp. coracana]
MSNNGNNGGSGTGAHDARNSRQDLQLQLAPPTGRMEVHNGNSSNSSSRSSFVSSAYDSSVLVLGGCKQCQRYCMVTKKEFPTCLNCKQPCLIGFSGGEKHY